MKSIYDIKTTQLIYFFIFLTITSCSFFTKKYESPAISWHEDFYRNLNSNVLDLKDPLKVFEFVFDHLREDATIFPSENFYYFNMVTSGHYVRGSLALHATTRDEGILEFAYYEVGATDTKTPFRHMLELNERNGVHVKKVSDNKYSVLYKKKKVFFSLKSNNDINIYDKKLLANESIVFNSNDESGLDFQIIYDSSNHHAYWVLNQRTFRNETFELIQNNLLIGNRSQFVFYLLESQKKMILVGALQYNVLRNEWYDGPFDQVADNAAYEKKINLKDFYLKIRPEVKKDSIDEYGLNLSRAGRIAPMPYFIYETIDELQIIIDKCEKKFKKQESNFIRCITPEP